MDSEASTYEVVYDEPATQRFDKAAIRFFWKEWLNSFLSEVWRFAIVAFAALLLYDIFRNADTEVVELLGSGLIAACIGAGWYLVVAFNDLANWRRADQGEVWQCALTDAGWSYRRRDGTLIYHPWTTMNLRFEHADGFLVSTTSGDVLVYRRPLQSAGLDSEFLERMRKA